MKLLTAHATDTGSATATLVDQLHGQTPTLLMLYGSAEAPLEAIRDGLLAACPGAAFVGATSCLGVMTQRGFHADQGPVGLLAIDDPQGAYGVGGCPQGDAPRAAAAAATEAALAQAGRIGEAPAVVWLTGAPGSEEALLAGIADVLGPSVPVVGGSSADNEVAGAWRQLTATETLTDGVTVTVLFPSGGVATSFASGYVPTATCGTATAVQGRQLLSIDGQPAAQVYNRWTQGLIQEAIDGGVVLGTTTLAPLGRAVPGPIGPATYTLSHPERIGTDGSIGLFTDIAVGEELVLMEGTVQSLVRRAGRVAAETLSAPTLGGHTTGALVVFCAGCMLTVQDQMPAVVDGLREALGDVPFLGVFTFGEQGQLPSRGNHHGNLMISVTAFGVADG